MYSLNFVGVLRDAIENRYYSRNFDTFVTTCLWARVHAGKAVLKYPWLRALWYIKEFITLHEWFASLWIYVTICISLVTGSPDSFYFAGIYACIALLTSVYVSIIWYETLKELRKAHYRNL